MGSQADAIKSTAFSLVESAFKTLTCEEYPSGRRDASVYFVFPHLVRDPTERSLLLDTYEQAIEETLTMVVDRVNVQGSKALYEAIPSVLKKVRYYLDEVYRGDSVATPWLLATPADYDAHDGATHVVQLRLRLIVEVGFSVFTIRRVLLVYSDGTFHEFPLAWPERPYP